MTTATCTCVTGTETTSLGNLFANVGDVVVIHPADKTFTDADIAVLRDGLAFPVALGAGDYWEVLVVTKDGTTATPDLVYHVTEEVGYRLLG